MPGMRCLAASCAWLLFATPAPAGQTPTAGDAPAAAATAAAAIPAPAKRAAAKAAEQRDQAQLAFQRDLVSVLAPRADAMPLLGAALLARPLFNQPPGNSFHALIERAAAADGAGPAVNWVRLADCEAKAGACPNPDA